MPDQDKQDNTNQPLPSTDLADTTESIAENVAGTLKTFLFAIGGVALLLSLWVLLPMFLTYLSEGDYRAPSQIHPTDTSSKIGQSNYNNLK